ncbi:hypothetical protein HC931_16685 [Candidatus Gracilibacteria bacterium]|nr:hypothetical protein [Candidatus Gracilibacteria bacterium]NJM87284.1 hypothetical protein [Hydrococcus sp. RU_2_2]NJQ98683.1 hypothetical protein [Hydrococcus sp. CSU_1_8]
MNGNLSFDKLIKSTKKRFMSTNPKKSISETIKELDKADKEFKKSEVNLIHLLGYIFGSFIFLSLFIGFLSSNNTSNSRQTTEYDSDSIIRRSGVGETVDSPEELVRLCITTAQSQGKSYSEASRICN